MRNFHLSISSELLSIVGTTESDVIPIGFFHFVNGELKHSNIRWDYHNTAELALDLFRPVIENRLRYTGAIYGLVVEEKSLLLHGPSVSCLRWDKHGIKNENFFKDHDGWELAAKSVWDAANTFYDQIS